MRITEDAQIISNGDVIIRNYSGTNAEVTGLVTSEEGEVSAYDVDVENHTVTPIFIPEQENNDNEEE